jgi:hypothetical protein
MDVSCASPTASFCKFVLKYFPTKSKQEESWLYYMGRGSERMNMLAATGCGVGAAELSLGMYSVLHCYGQDTLDHMTRY